MQNLFNKRSESCGSGDLMSMNPQFHCLLEECPSLQPFAFRSSVPEVASILDNINIQWNMINEQSIYPDHTLINKTVDKILDEKYRNIISLFINIGITYLRKEADEKYISDIIENFKISNGSGDEFELLLRLIGKPLNPKVINRVFIEEKSEKLNGTLCTLYDNGTMETIIIDKYNIDLFDRSLLEKIKYSESANNDKKDEK